MLPHKPTGEGLAENRLTERVGSYEPVLDGFCHGINDRELPLDLINNSALILDSWKREFHVVENRKVDVLLGRSRCISVQVGRVINPASLVAARIASRCPAADSSSRSVCNQ